MRILLVEDERDLAEIVRQGLVEEGYAVDVAHDGEDGAWRATTVDYDVAILDIVLPGPSGLEILDRMRAAGRTSPVIFLTARDTVEDRVRGLDKGGDDYLVKPFAWDELMARVRALLRRGSQGSEGVLRFEDLSLDPAHHVVDRAGRSIDLTAKEFQFLEVLIRNPEKVLTRTELIERVYDDGFDAMSNIVDVFVSRLRRKLNQQAGTPLLRTIRGVGYVLKGDSDAKP
jgi:DNA-binding response OmpR family regulator